MFDPWILNRSRWKKRLVHWLFEDANFRKVNLWRALTTKEAAQIREAGIKAPIVVTPNGLRLEDYTKPTDPTAPIETPLVPALKKTGPRLLFLGRIHPKKGIDLLLAAWGKSRHLRKDWELVIAGPDEGGHLAQLQQLARGEQGERVIFTGPVTGGKKNALLHSADMFVLPSRSEGFPVALLEAMACELPVVATRECNCPEVGSAQSGWECDASVESMTTALQDALRASESERKARGQNGRRVVETRYALPRVASTLLEACAAHC
jgi:glycosyltransferase involved in cell wall biosynthesis